MSEHTPKQIIMRRPSSFRCNPETLASNSYQNSSLDGHNFASQEQISQQAQIEFDSFVKKLYQFHIKVQIFDDQGEQIDEDFFVSTNKKSRPHKNSSNETTIAAGPETFTTGCSYENSSINMKTKNVSVFNEKLADSCFMNNWISFFPGENKMQNECKNLMVTYPMMSKNRRFERNENIIRQMKQNKTLLRLDACLE